LRKHRQIDNERTFAKWFYVDADLPTLRVDLLVTFLDEFAECQESGGKLEDINFRNVPIQLVDKVDVIFRHDGGTQFDSFGSLLHRVL
jgi:hypothetical protein